MGKVREMLEIAVHVFLTPQFYNTGCFHAIYTKRITTETIFTKYSKMCEFHQLFFFVVGERKLSVRKLVLAEDVVRLAACLTSNG
jgi:hypothetical protein